MSSKLEVNILLLKSQGVPDSWIKENLKNPLQEIEMAFLNLQNYGFIDKEGLLTDEGIDYLSAGFNF